MVNLGLYQQILLLVLGGQFFFIFNTSRGVVIKNLVCAVAFMKSNDIAFRINWIEKFIASSFNSTASLTIIKQPLLIMILISLLSWFLILSEVAISRLLRITYPIVTMVSSISSLLIVSFCKKVLFFHRQCFNLMISILSIRLSKRFLKFTLHIIKF